MQNSFCFRAMLASPDPQGCRLDKKNHLICRRRDADEVFFGKRILKKVSLADYFILNLFESIHREKAVFSLAKTLDNL